MQSTTAQQTTINFTEADVEAMKAHFHAKFTPANGVLHPPMQRQFGAPTPGAQPARLQVTHDIANSDLDAYLRTVAPNLPALGHYQFRMNTQQRNQVLARAANLAARAAVTKADADVSAAEVAATAAAATPAAVVTWTTL